MQAGVDGDGHPHVMGFPVKELKGDFPLRPECMGNLVPQQINLWMGAAPNGLLLCIPCHSLLNKRQCLDSGLLTFIGGQTAVVVPFTNSWCSR